MDIKNEAKKEKRKTKNCKLPGFIMGVKVPGNEKGDLEMALQQFKRMIKDSGLLIEYKRRTEYLKPSVVKREQYLKMLRKRKFDKLEEI